MAEGEVQVKGGVEPKRSKILLKHLAQSQQKQPKKKKAQKPVDTTPESPPKTKKPKAAAKNPTPKKESKKSPKASKASGEAEKPEAIEGKKKRSRHENFEDKSFARRVRPSGELTSLRWQVIRDVFYEKIHTNVPTPSSHQDHG